MTYLKGMSMILIMHPITVITSRHRLDGQKIIQDETHNRKGTPSAVQSQTSIGLRHQRRAPDSSTHLAHIPSGFSDIWYAV